MYTTCVVRDILDSLRPLLPRRLSDGRLDLSSLPSALWCDEDGRLYLALSLACFEDGDEQSSSDVREQHVCLGTFTEHAPARWRAFLEGTLRALPAIVAARGGAAAALPADLLYPEALADPSLVSEDDFAAALADPARLAAWNDAQEAEHWRELLAPCGLSDKTDEVFALGRPSLRLRLEGPDEEDDAQPRSRVGGDPDLPPDFEWPVCEGTPMTFVAQLDLAELAAYEAASELPAAGLLSFFYAPVAPEGDPLNPARVVLFEDPAGLVRRPAPPASEPLRAFAVELEEELVYPGLESQVHYEALLPPERVREFYRRYAAGEHGELIPASPLAALIFNLDEADQERPIHRLLGCAASVQGDPYLDVEVGTRGGYAGWAEGSEAALQARRAACRWRLLLQIDAVQDDELLLNQDGGFFYFWIPADALARRDFTAVRGELQCH